MMTKSRNINEKKIDRKFVDPEFESGSRTLPRDASKRITKRAEADEMMKHKAWNDVSGDAN